MQILVARGDITTQRVEAIVTAANVGLMGGGGVDGAVHHAAGPELLWACRELAPCPTGSAVITPAFDLAPVRWVIHAVGPVYRGTAEDTGLLQSAYTSSLARADEVGATSVALPSISTGSTATQPAKRRHCRSGCSGPRIPKSRRCCWSRSPTRWPGSGPRPCPSTDQFGGLLCNPTPSPDALDFRMQVVAVAPRLRGQPSRAGSCLG